MRKKGLLIIGVLVLVPVLCYGAVLFSLSYEGSPREAQRQAEALGAELERFLDDHRDALEALRAAAVAGAALPADAAREILNGAIEGADISRVYAEDGRVLVQLDNQMYTGTIYTTAWLGSGEPPLPEGAEEEGQTFWTFDRYHRMQILAGGWYAEYWSYPRG